MGLFDLLGIVRRYLALIILLTAIGGGAGWFFSARQTPQYQATTTLLINPAAPNQIIPFLPSAAPGSGPSNEWLASVYREYLKSRQFNLLVLERLNLPVSPEALATHTTAKLVPGTHIFAITASWHTPDGAARLADGVAETFIVAHGQKSAGATAPDDGTRAQIQQSLAYYQQAVTTLRADRDRLLLETNLDPVTKQQRLEEVERRLAPLEETYVQLLVQKPATGIDLVNQPSAIVLDAAAANIVPNRVPVERYILLSLFAGLLVGGGLAYLLTQFDRRIRLALDVERRLNQTPVGVVTAVRRQRWFRRSRSSEKIVVSTGRNLAQREAFRRLHTNISLLGADRLPRSLAITSPLPGEGKTFIAANLAVSLAQEGRRVVLVDANLQRPDLHAVFGLPNRTGFVDLLASPNLTASGVAQQSELHPNLWVITSGALSSRSTNALSAASLRRLSDELGYNADIVIYDLPDTETVSNGLIVAAACDATLLVIRSGQTQHEDLDSALISLSYGRTNVLGIVLNGAKSGARHAVAAPSSRPMVAHKLPKLAPARPLSLPESALPANPAPAAANPVPVATPEGQTPTPRMKWQRARATEAPVTHAE